MTKYVECWGADKPFANITDSKMAKNIGLAVSFLLLLLLLLIYLCHSIPLFTNIDFKNFNPLTYTRTHAHTHPTLPTTEYSNDRIQFITGRKLLYGMPVLGRTTRAAADDDVVSQLGEGNNVSLTTGTNFSLGFDMFDGNVCVHRCNTIDCV